MKWLQPKRATGSSWASRLGKCVFILLLPKRQLWRKNYSTIRVQGSDLDKMNNNGDCLVFCCFFFPHFVQGWNYQPGSLEKHPDSILGWVSIKFFVRLYYLVCNIWATLKTRVAQWWHLRGGNNSNFGRKVFLNKVEYFNLTGFFSPLLIESHCVLFFCVFQ